MEMPSPPRSTNSSQRNVTANTAPSFWSPFRHPVYRWLWLATVVANTGTWMYNAAAGWLMTSLSPNALLVSLVQVANSLPMFLFALPAGALADIIDKRRFILALEILTAVVSAVFAALVSFDLVTPGALLMFMFLIASFAALEAPAWQSIVPQLVPKPDLSPAIAANSVGVNISRAIGPALAGVIITALGIAAPFWLDAVSGVGVIVVFWWWRSRQTPPRSLPAERITSAIRTGYRHVRNNRYMRATLARAVGFFLFASAYWALLPLVARTQLDGGPQLYGILLGAIGAGAIGGAFVLSKLKATIGANGLVVAGELGTAVSLVLFAFAGEPIMAAFASVIAGMCWIAVLASLNVSAQLALPDWVRGRGLAMYVTVFFGTMTLGSVLWGALANEVGLRWAHLIAAVGALLAVPLTWAWRLQTGPGPDLTPSMHWPAPVVVADVEIDAGPVLVSVQYVVDPEKRDAFLRAIDRVAAERKRDGAYAWGIFQDTADPSRFVETFLLESWIEHLRQHQRVTRSDQLVEQRVRQFLREPVRVTHLIAAEPADDGDAAN
jgi:MFS family permease